MRARSNRYSLWFAGAVVLLLAFPVGAGSGTEERATSHPSGPHHPPKSGRWVGDHWTPYDPPAVESFPEGSEVYRIRPKDTLWDLAGRFFSDPYLWPQIWDANRYILDSHWIYPGDPLLIPERPTVISEVRPQVEQPGPPVPDTAPPPPGTAPIPLKTPGAGFQSSSAAPAAPAPASPAAERREPTRIAYADTTDLECLGQIVKKYSKSDLFIAESEEPAKMGLATDDIVYLNGGSEDGVAPGDQYSVVRKQAVVHHPVTGKRIGDFVQSLGRLRVIAVQARTSIARIEFACFRMERGLDLIPYEPIASPVGGIPKFDYFAIDETDAPKGYVVYAGGRIRPSDGQMMHVDLGTDQGLTPGDFIAVFVDTPRPRSPQYKFSYTYENQEYSSLWRKVEGNRDFPRRILGHGVVIVAEPATSVVKVLDTVEEIEVGARVELK